MVQRQNDLICVLYVSGHTLLTCTAGREGMCARVVMPHIDAGICSLTYTGRESVLQFPWVVSGGLDPWTE